METKMECMHLFIESETTGGRWFAGGELHDTLQETTICADCEKVLNIPVIEPTPGFDLNEITF